MSSVDSQPMSNTPSYAERERIDDTPSARFTAVNGRDASTASDNHKSRSDMNGNANTLPRLSPPNSRSAERLMLSTRREEWVRPPASVEGPQTNSIISDQHPLSAHANSHHSSPHKRKRSESEGRHSASAASYQSQVTSHSPTRDHPEFIDSGLGPDGSEVENQERRNPSNGSPAHDQRGRTLPRPVISEVDVRNSAPHPQNSWYAQGLQGSAAPYSAPPNESPVHTDAQLAEALQRESRNLDANRATYSGGTPEEEEGEPSYNKNDGGDHGANRTPQSGVQIDHKRRKRVFSNRTKTGCMTCRRRKKKCDEAKPECNNCTKGGFVCEGYNLRNAWQKTSTTRAPVPLQAKEDHHSVAQPTAPPAVGTAAAPAPSSASSSSQPSYRVQRDPSPPLYASSTNPPVAQHRPSEGRQVRPIVVDDDHASPHGPGSRSIWKPGWSQPQPTNPTYYAEHAKQPEFARVPSIHELPRGDQLDSLTTPSPATASHRSILHPSNTNSPNTPKSQAKTAQIALQHAATLRPRIEKTQKQKMLAGELYLPFSAQLVEERERCKAACWRFNNATNNPTLGVSREERGRLFREILQPRELAIYTSPECPSPLGKVGERVIVDAPFTCDYGYNITIGDDVVIGANCTILDTCTITIGARCIFGPNVSLFGATLPIDPRRRNGSQGPALGRSIVVEEDCWIGGGVTILPGIRIGKSSTVGAGSIVTRDVPRFTVVAGNPARVHRGIYQNEQM